MPLPRRGHLRHRQHRQPGLDQHRRLSRYVFFCAWKWNQHYYYNLWPWSGHSGCWRRHKKCIKSCVKTKQWFKCEFNSDFHKVKDNICTQKLKCHSCCGSPPPYAVMVLVFTPEVSQCRCQTLIWWIICWACWAGEMNLKCTLGTIWF